MSFVSYRNTLVAGALALMATAGVTAQTHDEHAPATCGMRTMAAYDRAAALENTRRNDPKLYERIVSGRSDRTPARLMAEDDLELSFIVHNRVTNQYEDVVAVLRYDGIYSRVWVDVKDTARADLKPTSAKMRTLFKALDTAVTNTNVTPRNRDKGILANDIDVFGDIPRGSINVENKTDFLMLDIKDAVAGQNVLGYFSPNDQVAGPESNLMNLLYIDSKEGLQQMQTMLAIIAHEFQHLIHYGRHPRPSGDDISRDVALNEGMSEVASILNGYHFRSNNAYLSNTNIPMLEWHYDNATDQEIDYQRAMTFAHYMSEQYGERFLYELVGSPENNMARVSDALRRYGMPEGFDYKEVLKGFAVANYLQSSSNPSYRYNYKLKGGAARAHKTHSGTSFDATGSAIVEAYGTYYLQYNSPGAMRMRIGGSGDIRTMLIGIRAGDTTVVELQPNTDYTLPVWQGGPYQRMTLAFVNTGGGARDVSWTAEALTASVGDETGALGRLGFAGVVDNGDGSATLAFSLPASAPVRLELYNVRGERVRTVIGDELRSAGSHRETVSLEGLPNGSYVARLVQNGAPASTMVFVAR